MLNFCFITSKRNILAWNRVVWRITRENRFSGVGCRLLEEPGKKRSRVNILMRNFAHTGKNETHWGIVTKFCMSVDIQDVITCAIFLWRSVKGFGRGKGSNFPFSHWLASSPLQHSRTTVRVCDLTRCCTTCRSLFACSISGQLWEQLPAAFLSSPFVHVTDVFFCIFLHCVFEQTLIDWLIDLVYNSGASTYLSCLFRCLSAFPHMISSVLLTPFDIDLRNLTRWPTGRGY